MKRVIFVDDDPAESILLQRELRELEGEWEMVFVESGRAALAALGTGPFDAVVSDMVMPEMDGAELLSAVREKQPTALRIILSGTVDEIEAFRAVGPTQVWLPKPCNVQFLRAIVERGTAWRDFLTNPRVSECVGRLKTLPSVPHLYLSLVEELRSPDTSFRRVAEIIAGDVGMASKVLKMVNSAFFGFYRNITSLEQAISILGLKMIKALVLSVKVFSEFDQSKLPEFSIEALMSHSVAVGSMARLIVRAETKDRHLADDAFVAGLLHDVGKLIMADNMPEEYGQVLRARDGNDIVLGEVEEALFGATHADIGAYLLALWGMADSVVASAAYHHRPICCAEQGFGSMTAVHAANAFSQVGDPVLSPESGPEIDAEYLSAIGMSDRIEQWMNFCNILAQ